MSKEISIFYGRPCDGSRFGSSCDCLLGLPSLGPWIHGGVEAALFASLDPVGASSEITSMI